jgi:transcriptional regulator with XRE-family HTH domain
MLIAMDDHFSASRFLRRARRIADLSQRELAQAAGMPQSTVARIEAERMTPRVDCLDRLLRATGCQLAVVDGDGWPLAPMGEDRYLDQAGRRFPAHLDLRKGGNGIWWGRRDRWLEDRPVPAVTFDRNRQHRDRLRAVHEFRDVLNDPP